MDVAEWLQDLGLKQYAPVFCDNRIDSSILPQLTMEDLKDLGITLVGDRRRLLEAIAALRISDTSTSKPVVTLLPSALSGDDRSDSAETEAERRRLTVMFCDLVDSTLLSARLDPEDLGKVIREYQQRVADTISRFGGFIALYIGDGVLIYFGWPEAHEMDPERAVRAALAVVAAVGETPVGREHLHVRIGVATGLVVVGETIGSGAARQRTVAGETPNRAARLQNVAGPDGIAIDSATHQQIGRLFECRDLGALALKGLPDAVQIWLVQGESALASRFEALRAGQLTPLIGREEELDLLLRRWRRAVRGEGQVVLISGEPGIGKSRLIAALEERLREESCTRLSYFCSPYHQKSPLRPMIGQLERAAGFARGDTDSDKLRKLRALLAGTATSNEDTALLADLLSIPEDNMLPILIPSPQRRRERTFEALVHQIEALARLKPALMLVEDVHWVDPSSRELLDVTIERLAGLPVLLIITFRPEFRATWIGRAGVSIVTLARFDRRETAAFANAVAARVIPGELLQRIVTRTDGVPLFIEELTRAVLEAGLADASSQLTVPETLHASLMSRLDQLPGAKTAAQIGSVIGRSFTYELIAAVAQLPEPIISEGLHQLVSAGLVFQRGEWPDANYTFKHALVQDAAYQSLLRGRRAAFHARLVEVLLQQGSGIEESQPDLLAYHCEQGGLTSTAVEYFIRAASRSWAKGAVAEAHEHSRNALRVIATLPAGTQRDRIELPTLFAFSHSVALYKGDLSPALDDINARLIELWERLGKPLEFAFILSRQLFALVARSDVKGVLDLADTLLDLSCNSDYIQGRITGQLFAGAARMLGGELTVARQHLEEVVGSRNFRRDGVGLPGYFQITAQTYLSFTTCWSGYPDLALTHSSAALDNARHYEGIPSLIETLTKHVELLSFVAKQDEVEVHLPELLELTRKHGFVWFGARAEIMEGYLLSGRGDAERGKAKISRGISNCAATGYQLWGSRRLALLAEAYLMVRDYDRAIEILIDALALTERTGEKWYSAELHRQLGEVSMARNNDVAAEDHFQQARGIALVQGAKLWELRALTSLARLWQKQGRCGQAYNILYPIYHWFTEGLDTFDLKRAKVLLNKLG